MKRTLADADPSSPDEPAVEAILRDKPTLFEAIWQGTGEYLAVVDRQGIIRACNRVDEGFTMDQIVGHSLVRFTLPDSSAALTKKLEQVFAEGSMQTLETTVSSLDGVLSYFSLRLAPLRQDGRTVAVLACCENIRPLKDSEQALTRERNVLRRLLDIQERERQLVSYDIHDGLAQYLAGAVMHFQAFAHEAANGATTSNFDEGMKLLEAAAVESRRLIGGLRPPALDELGIVDALESLVEDARADVPAVALNHSLPGGRLPPQLETIIFRIVQEALTNARKYAEARRIDVTLERIDGHVRVVVRDDGRGFDPAVVSEERFGLEGIRQRCRLLGGESRIASAPGMGTTIEALLPIPACE